MSVNPYEPPVSQPYAAAVVSGESREKLRRVAKYQQWMILSLLAMIIMNVANVMVPSPLELRLVIAIAVIGSAVVSTWLLCRELIGIVGTIISVILLFVPLASLITLLVINQKASDFLKKNGVKVGFFGTSPSKIG